MGAFREASAEQKQDMLPIVYVKGSVGITDTVEVEVQNYNPIPVEIER